MFVLMFSSICVSCLWPVWAVAYFRRRMQHRSILWSADSTCLVCRGLSLTQELCKWRETATLCSLDCCGLACGINVLLICISLSRLEHRPDMAIRYFPSDDIVINCTCFLDGAANWYVFCLQMIQKAPLCLLSSTTQAAHLRWELPNLLIDINLLTVAHKHLWEFHQGARDHVVYMLYYHAVGVVWKKSFCCEIEYRLWCNWTQKPLCPSESEYEARTLPLSGVTAHTMTWINSQ